MRTSSLFRTFVSVAICATASALTNTASVADKQVGLPSDEIVITMQP